MRAADAIHRPVETCAVCGSKALVPRDVLWPELTRAWELSEDEERYVNRQQGLHCERCKNNLRMIGLGAAITRAAGFPGTLADFCDSDSPIRILEVNTAGFLTQFLRRLPHHRVVEYPAFDMMALDLPSGGYDLVVHSDSLEHVADPVRGLAECRRVLRAGGQCLFTVPIVVGRLTRSRDGLARVYHGYPGCETEDQLVRTEFGADAWRFALEAGFRSCEIEAFEYPAALTLAARK